MPSRQVSVGHTLSPRSTGQATPGAFSPLSRLRPETRTSRSPPSSQQGPVRVSGTLRPVLAPASPQALPILSHPLAALRTSGGERGAGCQRPPTRARAGLRQRGPGRFPEEKFEAKSGGWVDSRGTRSRGGVWLSARTHSTDTQPRHVDRLRPRTRTRHGAHRQPRPNASPQNVGTGAKQLCKVTDTQRHRRTHVPDPKSTKTHNSEMHVSAQRPHRRRPTPTAPGQRLCLLEALSPLLRVPHCRRVPGVRQRLLSPWLQVKLRGLGGTRAPSTRGMAGRGRGLRTLSRCADSGST